MIKEIIEFIGKKSLQWLVVSFFFALILSFIEILISLFIQLFLNSLGFSTLSVHFLGFEFPRFSISMVATFLVGIGFLRFVSQIIFLI